MEHKQIKQKLMDTIFADRDKVSTEKTQEDLSGILEKEVKDVKILKDGISFTVDGQKYKFGVKLEKRK